MKVFSLFTFILLSFFILFYSIENEGFVAKNKIFSSLFNRQINIEGNKVVPAEQILNYANDVKVKSNVWWFLNKDFIKISFKQNRFLKNVQINSCKRLSFACYKIVVSEKIPKFILKNFNSYWLVSNDLAFIAPLNAGDVNHYFFNLPVVEDSFARTKAPEYLRARLAYINRELDFLSKAYKKEVRHLVLLDEGEMSVGFYGEKFITQFSNYERYPNKRGEEKHKLNQILAYLGKENASTIELAKIDLTLDNYAVVTN